ncbi:MAG: Fpg/Nei family DNA glycosylase [Rudaea sp.]
MPELPELEVVREVLNRRVAGTTVTGAETFKTGATVVRDLTQNGFAASLTHAFNVGAERRGKFLILELRPADGEQPDSPLYLVINPKLTGRLQLARPGDKRHARTAFVLSLSSGDELRYFDQKSMGQAYLTRDLAFVPELDRTAPDALTIGLDEFRSRLRLFRGEIKGILTRGDFVAGIGNAYADEILWAARLNPFRKRTQLTEAETERLYEAMRATLAEATAKVRDEMGEHIERKPRDFMAVHMRAGEPCPRCGSPVSLVGANRRITNFCRKCQPGGLIKGM